jgi:hypothetical protein
MIKTELRTITIHYGENQEFDFLLTEIHPDSFKSYVRDFENKIYYVTASNEISGQFIGSRKIRSRASDYKGKKEIEEILKSMSSKISLSKFNVCY